MFADMRSFSFVVIELISVSLMLASRRCCRREAGIFFTPIVMCLLPLSVDIAPIRMCMCFKKNVFVCC